MTLFAHDNYVMSKTPPDKSIAIGRAAVEKDWQANFDRVAELHLLRRSLYPRSRQCGVADDYRGHDR